MSPDDQAAILAQLIQMDPYLEDTDTETQYVRCMEVWGKLDDYRNYALEETIDAVTWERRWHWRKKR